MRRGLKVGELVTRDTDVNEVVSLIVGGPGGESAAASEAARARSPAMRQHERAGDRGADALSTAERRAYRQLSDANGRMLVVACDQRGAMRAVLAATPEDRAAISNAQLGEVKADLVRHLANHAPSVLLDPECALPRVVDEDVLARDVGLLVAMDASGWQTRPGSPLRHSAVIPGVDAARVRAVGGTAAKILVYMRPDREGEDGHAVQLISMSWLTAASTTSSWWSRSSSTGSRMSPKKRYEATEARPRPRRGRCRSQRARRSSSFSIQAPPRPARR